MTTTEFQSPHDSIRDWQPTPAEAQSYIDHWSDARIRRMNSRRRMAVRRRLFKAQKVLNEKGDA